MKPSFIYFDKESRILVNDAKWPENPRIDPVEGFAILVCSREEWDSYKSALSAWLSSCAVPEDEQTFQRIAYALIGVDFKPDTYLEVNLPEWERVTQFRVSDGVMFGMWTDLLDEPGAWSNVEYRKILRFKQSETDMKSQILNQEDTHMAMQVNPEPEEERQPTQEETIKELKYAIRDLLQDIELRKKFNEGFLSIPRLNEISFLIEDLTP